MSGSGKKRKKSGEAEDDLGNSVTLTDQVDESYFRGYSDIGIHEEMLADKIRTNAYRLAILRNYEDIRGKVVADIGAGTGILSMFCVQAGASKVYAIEASDIAEQIQLVVKANKMEDRITVIHGKVEDVELPEKVDIIVSEWMGYLLLYECMLPSVLCARDKWLKQDGLLFPSVATLYMAPFTYSQSEKDSGGCFWQDVSSWYKVDLSPLKPFAQQCQAQKIHISEVLPQEVQAHASTVCKLDLNTVTTQDLTEKRKFSFQCFGHAKIHGFVCWFDVGFPRDVVLSTSPYKPVTHWAQSVIYIKDPIDVEQDTVLSGSIQLSPNFGNKRFLDIVLDYAVNNGASSTHHYVMDDFLQT